MTLNQITFDLLNIIRGAKITDDEPISERQIESWIHSYRSKLLKQDLDKGKYSNPSYIQEVLNNGSNLIELKRVTTPLKDIWKTTIEIPTTIDLNYKSGITYIGDFDGNQIPLEPESRINFAKYKKFTRNYPIAYIKGSYIYLYNPEGLKYISIKGIFNNPMDIEGVTADSEYPIPSDMLDTLRGMILKQELGIEYKSPSDDINDSQHNLIDSDIR